MGNGRAGKACTNDHNICSGWELMSAAVAVKFVWFGAPKGIERGRCGRRGERHCCVVGLNYVNYNLSSCTHSSIGMSFWPAQYQLLVDTELGEHYLETNGSCTTGPVHDQDSP